MGPQDLPASTTASLLGRASPLIKLAIALGWLIGLAFTTAPGPPLAIVAITLVGGLLFGRVGVRRLIRTLLPLTIAALGIGVFNLLFAASNTDPAAVELARLGPFRVTTPAFWAGLGLGLRVLAIASVGAVFVLTTEATRLVDALVQQAHLSPRFAYGTLAAYQAVPRLGEDLVALRQARRVRGLRSSWHPRLLVGLLVLAIRHGDQLALAMDARAFGSGPRSHYRIVDWQRVDLVLGASALLVLVLALRLG